MIRSPMRVAARLESVIAESSSVLRFSARVGARSTFGSAARPHRVLPRHPPASEPPLDRLLSRKETRGEQPVDLRVRHEARQSRKATLRPQSPCGPYKAG